MRIWHEKLIPKLCQKHLCAMWREGLGAWNIIQRYYTTFDNKLGYINHPATQEFIKSPKALLKRLKLIREEMICRGYHPKELPEAYYYPDRQRVKIWQTLEQQVEILKAKKCKCKI